MIPAIEINMNTIRIKLDFLCGPIWKDYFNEVTKTESTGVDIVDNDEKLKELGKEISNMFNSYYMFNVDDKPVVFNEVQERRDRDKMLSLLDKLNKRLEEINDGSFVVEDEETPRVKKLKPLDK